MNAGEPLAGPRGKGLERWLESAWGRWLLAALLVLVATLVTTAQRHEILSARGAEVEIWPILWPQLVYWGLWALVGWLAIRLAVWLHRRLGSWVLFLLAELALSLLVAAGMTLATDELGLFPGRGGRMDGPPRSGSRESRRGDRPRGERPPFDRTVWVLRIRLPRELFVYWVVLGIGAGVHTVRRSRREERRAADLELRTARLHAELADAQIDSLRSQLHPHFLFNALHTVGGLVRAGDEQAALGTLAALGGLLRTTLDQGDAQEASLRDELGVAQRYLEIERRRFGDRLQVEWEVAPDCLEARVPVLFLLPLVENAVRHGVAPRTEGGRIWVSARREGERLRVEVRDDGPGFPAEVLERGPAAVADDGGRRRIGLANDAARLEMLYGEAQRIDLSNGPEGGARVLVELPFRESAGTGDGARVGDRG